MRLPAERRRPFAWSQGSPEPAFGIKAGKCHHIASLRQELPFTYGAQHDTPEFCVSAARVIRKLCPQGEPAGSGGVGVPVGVSVLAHPTCGAPGFAFRCAARVQPRRLGSVNPSLALAAGSRGHGKPLRQWVPAGAPDPSRGDDGRGAMSPCPMAWDVCSGPVVSMASRSESPLLSLLIVSVRPRWQVGAGCAALE